MVRLDDVTCPLQRRSIKDCPLIPFSRQVFDRMAQDRPTAELSLVAASAERGIALAVPQARDCAVTRESRSVWRRVLGHNATLRKPRDLAACMLEVPDAA